MIRNFLLTILFVLLLLGNTPSHAALTFDGDDDYATAVGYKGVTGTAARSFSFWFKTGSTASATDEMFGWGDNSGAGAGKGFRFSLESGIIWGRFNAGVTAQWGSGLADDVWHNFVYTFPSAGNNEDALVYIDGSVSTGTFANGATALNTDSESDVGISVNATDVTSQFVGEMTEVAIWNSVVTSSEASVLYSSKIKRLVLQIQPSALQSCWFLDDLTEGGNLASATLKDSCGSNDMTGSDAGASGGQGLSEDTLSYVPY